VVYVTERKKVCVGQKKGNKENQPPANSHQLLAISL
jgi:hypothetical protein